RPFDLVERAERVDDVAADVARSPDVVDHDLPAVEARLDDLGEIAEVAVVEAEPLGPALVRPAAEIRHRHDLLDHALGARRAEAGLLAERPARAGERLAIAEQLEHQRREVAPLR